VNHLPLGVFGWCGVVGDRDLAGSTAVCEEVSKRKSESKEKDVRVAPPINWRGCREPRGMFVAVPPSKVAGPVDLQGKLLPSAARGPLPA